jgi:hypothetical protein
MLKRGQVSVFLVVGIVILLLSALFFFIFGQLTKAPLEVEAEQAVESLGPKGAVQAYVEECMKKTIEPSLYLLALQGGLIYPDEESKILLTEHGVVNYAWLNGVNGISKEKMEQDLAMYMQENVEFCLGDFDTFSKQNVVIKADYLSISGQTSIQDSLVNAKLHLPLQIILASNDSSELQNFEIQTESSLGTIFKDVEALPFADLHPAELAGLPYLVTVFPFDQSVTIYSFSEEKPADAEPLNFLFAVRNDLPANTAPQLTFIPDKIFRVGEIWKEQLTADDQDEDILNFYSDSTLFPINKEGNILVKINNPGIFKVRFEVDDGRGGKDQQEVSILVRQ